MSSSPRVSVLMTVFNAAPYLREAIDSIVGQTFADWELVIFDNGSMDGSADILRSYSDERIHLTLSPTNLGRTPALRAAFALARGEYCAVLDADDVAHEVRLSEQVAFMDAHSDVALLGAWTTYINANGDDIGTCTPPVDGAELYELLGWNNPFVHSATIYRRALAARLGGYPLDFPYAQDCGLWLRLAQHGSLATLPRFLCKQRILQVSMSRATQFRIPVAADALLVLAYAREHLTLDRRGRRFNRDQTTITELKYAVALSRSGRRREAVGRALRALIANPAGFVWNSVLRRRIATAIS